MRCRYLSTFSSLALAGVLFVVGPAQGGRGSETRDPHVCLNGPNAGLACTNDNQCPQSKCRVRYLHGPGSIFPATLTIIVDDNVSKWDGSEEVTNVHAVTIFLQTQFQGERYFLAQTYQNLEDADDLTKFLEALEKGPVIADSAQSTGLNIDEKDLNDALDPANEGTPLSLLDDLLWQWRSETGGNELVEELRLIFGVTGRPVIVGVPRLLEQVRHSNYEANGLASVARLRVLFRFVPVTP